MVMTIGIRNRYRLVPEETYLSGDLPVTKPERYVTSYADSSTCSDLAKASKALSSVFATARALGRSVGSKV